ncbi:chromate efflux transporter [Nitrosomonas nitrosa]|uniref:chromate efflux transporter n=1 Tax=Nitrosomonas nitrosa TaxID=52442 RepID=UPI0023F8BC12|nr:chromate efflux transporter [Nitrosomonas nitrosa]MCO6434000.1 chromate efflux transporter [Nitrosomonas nitrosa]
MPSARSHRISYQEAFHTWLKIGLLSFGGPAGQIAIMHRILVEEKRWISESRFLHALNYCMLIPGPEAQQLTIYIGWLLHGWRGGVVAGTLFVLPGFLSIFVLSLLYALYQQTELVTALFFGLKAATLAIVVEAVFRIGRKVLKNRTMVILAACAFVGIFFLELPFPLIVLAAGLIGLIGGHAQPKHFCVIHGHEAATEERNSVIHDHQINHTQPTWGRAIRVTALWLAIWFVPIALLFAWLGSGHVLFVESLFFSKAAVVTFGGAYAVLAYMAQQAVEVYGWLQPGEMLDGLGMAETTPGPLIQVVQFVGFMGAYRNPDPFDPLMAATMASVITTWVTFVPCFLWILLGAPYIERLRDNKLLSAGLSAITAAVVGVVLNLAIWFAAHVAFGHVEEWRGFGLRLLLPEWASADYASIVIALGAFFAMFKLKWNMILTFGVASLTGIGYVLLIYPWLF